MMVVSIVADVGVLERLVIVVAVAVAIAAFIGILALIGMFWEWLNETIAENKGFRVATGVVCLVIALVLGYFALNDNILVACILGMLALLVATIGVSLIFFFDSL